LNLVLTSELVIVLNWLFGSLRNCGVHCTRLLVKLTISSESYRMITSTRENTPRERHRSKRSGNILLMDAFGSAVGQIIVTEWHLKKDNCQLYTYAK